jgi:predicted dehydrogenase
MLHVGTHTFDLLRYLAGDIVEIAARLPDYAADRDLPAVGFYRPPAAQPPPAASPSTWAAR